MEPSNRRVSERPQQAVTAESQYDLMTEPIVVVTAVEFVSQSSVSGLIFGKVRVEKIDGHLTI